jgi:hypothetical protein
MSNYTYHGTSDLIAMPGRSVQTYPSGLVRVERSFMCRKADVARYRNTFRVNEPMPFDDGAPAIDGLFIFPEPQEQVRDDGFVEFRVTAYGRTSLGGFLETRYLQGVFDSSVTTNEFILGGLTIGLIPFYVQKIILQNQEISVFDSPVAENINPTSVQMRTSSGENSSYSFVPFDIWKNYMASGATETLKYKGFEFYPPWMDIDESRSASVTLREGSFLIQDTIQSTNFGIFNEYTITYRSAYAISFNYTQ